MSLCPSQQCSDNDAPRVNMPPIDSAITLDELAGAVAEYSCKEESKLPVLTEGIGPYSCLNRAVFSPPKRCFASLYAGEPLMKGAA